MRKYYDLSSILKADADINIIDGAREMGKSWAGCEYALTRSYKTYGKEGGIAFKVYDSLYKLPHALCCFKKFFIFRLDRFYCSVVL